MAEEQCRRRHDRAVVSQHLTQQRLGRDIMRFELEVGKVKDGKVVFDAKWPDGTSVKAIIFEEVPVQISDELREELLLSIASGEIGDGKDAFESLDEILRELDAEEHKKP